eukprot:TRINITY_DN978_c3_g1_i1.p1 TRINITY_DN978_c3_g1~~TRINITY_DN978_c3_g1_i1.p1  ORF type:complete len:162 (+),score=46.40 TRINITY_DN978_c3_g1_i1:62-487(+)
MSSLIVIEVTEWTSRVQVIKQQEAELMVFEAAWEAKLKEMKSPRSILRSVNSTPLLSPLVTTKKVSFGRLSSFSSDQLLLPDPVLDILTYVKVEEEDEDEDSTSEEGLTIPLPCPVLASENITRCGSSLSYLCSINRAMRG